MNFNPDPHCIGNLKIMWQGFLSKLNIEGKGQRIIWWNKTCFDCYSACKQLNQIVQYLRTNGTFCFLQLKKWDKNREARCKLVCHLLQDLQIRVQTQEGRDTLFWQQRNNFESEFDLWDSKRKPLNVHCQEWHGEKRIEKKPTEKQARLHKCLWAFNVLRAVSKIHR